VAFQHPAAKGTWKSVPSQARRKPARSRGPSTSSSVPCLRRTTPANATELQQAVADAVEVTIFRDRSGAGAAPVSAPVTGDLPDRNRASRERHSSERDFNCAWKPPPRSRESVAFRSTTSVVGAPPEYRRRVQGVESSSQPFAPPIVSGVRRTCWHTQCSLSFVFDLPTSR
jgi:hypothetical protein